MFYNIFNKYYKLFKKWFHKNIIAEKELSLQGTKDLLRHANCRLL
jgi:hypothetical protein